MHVPGKLEAVTVLPVMLQAPEASTLTTRFESEVGLTVNIVPAATGLGGCTNVIVWFALEAVTVWMTLVAGL